MPLHDLHNRSNGILYVQEYDIEDLDEFKCILQDNYVCKDGIRAPLLRHDMTVRRYLW